MNPQPDRGRKAPNRVALVLVSILALLVLLLLSASSTAAAEGEYQDHAPINITGDEEMDSFFEGTDGDGTSWETAYTLEGLSIDGTGAGAAISLVDTDRYLRIEDCRLYASDGSGATGLYLDGCGNITVWNSTFPGSDTGVIIGGCYRVSLWQNEISNQRNFGVLVDGSVSVQMYINEIADCREAVRVRGSEQVEIGLNKISSNDVGISVDGTESCDIQSNEVWWSAENAIVLNNADDANLFRNHVHENGWSGIQLSASSGCDLYRNVVEDNYRGIWLTGADGNSVEGNNLTGNDAAGLRMTDSDGNEITSNLIAGNGPLGIDLESADDNTFENNSIIANFRGVSFSGSTGNVFVENRLIGNVLGAYLGDTSGNSFEGNVLRANGWLMGLLFLVVVLVIIGIVAYVYFWLKRRGKGKEERGRILVRRRFPSGGKGLWALSKYLWDEDFFRSQLESAGPQREMVLERYRHSIDSARMTQYMLVGIMAVFLAFMAALPLAALMNLITMDIDGTNSNDAIFATGVAFGLYYMMSMVILLVFGLLFLAQLMKGEDFRLLATLPMDQRGNRRVVLYMLLRMYAVPFIVMLVSLPVGGFLLTWSFTFLVVSLLVNLLVLAFLAFLLVLTANLLSRKVFSGNTSRGSTVLRVVVMASYMAIMMTVFVALQYLVGVVSDLYTAQRLSGGSGEIINGVVSLIPFPFSGGYLVGLTLVPSEAVPPTVLATTLAGMGLLLLATYGMRRVGQRVLERVAMGQELPGAGPGHVAQVADIDIATRRTIPAFIHNSLLVTSRDMGSIIYLVMPILFPFILIITMISEPDISIFEPLFPFLMYLGITAFLVNMALSTADANVGGILSALPYRTVDQYRARWSTMAIFMMIPLVVILLLFINRVPDPTAFAVLMLSMVSFVIFLSSLYLVTFSMAFGTVNRRHTFFMARIENKLAKYVGIVALQYVLVAIIMGAFWVLYTSDAVTFGAGIAAIWVVNLTLFAVLELAARRLFR